MNQEPPLSFPEQAAHWLQGTEFAVYVATGVALLAYQFPAYKRFRTRALLLLVLSSALGLFVTVFDETIGRHGPPALGYEFLRELTWLATVILGTVGSLMFLRDYARLASDARTEPPSPSSPATEPAKPDDRSLHP